MTAPDKIIAKHHGWRVVQGQNYPTGEWFVVGYPEPFHGTEYTRSDLIPNAAYVAGLEGALKDDRQAILDLTHARYSEVEGSDEDWVGDIDAALKEPKP